MKFLFLFEICLLNQLYSIQTHGKKAICSTLPHRIVEESKYEEILGLHFPTGSSELKYENKEEFIDLCKNNENLDTWLDIIAKKPVLISGYSEVCNSIKKCPNKSYALY